MSTDKLNIRNEMAAADRKDRDYYDSFDSEEKKKFAPFLMIRWTSSVKGNADMQAYYLMSVNERLNKNFFWLLTTTVSPGMGNQFHQWIAPKKKESNNKAVKFLRQIFPERSEKDLELMAQINDTRDLKDLAREHGWDDKRIKSDL